MSHIRTTHPGYFQVTVGLCIAYMGLGVAFALTSGTRIEHDSETYSLISAYVPLWGWGILYGLLGSTLAVALGVPGVPHRLVRYCCALGLMLTTFWLSIFWFALFVGRLDLPTVIPTFSLAWLVEFAAIREPETGPQVPGPPGAPGLQGPAGPQGDTGVMGERGVAGDTGHIGEQGAQGKTGDTGDVGARGLRGLTGDTGADGDKGSTGQEGHP